MSLGLTIFNNLQRRRSNFGFVISRKVPNTTMYQSVPEFYEGKSIFLTGGTGFLGKVLLEKLLYGCTGIDKIYILVRNKRNLDFKTRTETLMKIPVFSRIHKEKPELLKKVVMINGSLVEKNIGISEEDTDTLVKKVDVVFHVAACVKFNLSLEEAIKINVDGTEKVLELCRKMEKLKSFVYVSTAYSNPDRFDIEEVLYPPPCSLDNLKKLILAGISDEEVKKIIGNRPNTYTFSKALAENLIAQKFGDIPSIIVRPSIICATETEPVAGWIDSLAGATLLISFIGKGVNRVLLCDPKTNIDIVPADYTVNLIIVAAAKGICPHKVEVFHSSTSVVNPLTFGRLIEIILIDAREKKWNIIPMSSMTYTKSRLKMNIITACLQKLPAHLADFGLTLKCSQPKYVSMSDKVLLVRTLLEFFTDNSWNIHAPKAQILYSALSESDKKIFPCDPSYVDWSKYIPAYIDGFRHHLKL